MANEEQLSILKQGVEVWNRWRLHNSGEQNIAVWPKKYTGIRPDLSNADLSNLDLSTADLSRSDLNHSNLRRTKLRNADLERANLHKADLAEALLDRANLHRADLSDAILVRAALWKAELGGANLRDADLNKSYLSKSTLHETDLQRANLSGADLSNADLYKTQLNGATLVDANLSYSSMKEANLSGANLRGANLRGANLRGTSLVQTIIDKADVSQSLVYGISVWDLKGEFGNQTDLVITPPRAQIITVDNIRVAQFIYLILNNAELRDVINTLTSKSVLILGRFAPPERKLILDALRNKLREYNLLPIVFDFDRPIDKDFTEAIKTIAGLCYFVIADITNPKSSPLELQATIPDYQIPFVPIIQEGASPFAMMLDLQTKYNWVLDTLSYKSIDELIQALKPAIIDPAIQKHNELRLIKARQPKIRSASDFIEDKGLA